MLLGLVSGTACAAVRALPAEGGPLRQLAIAPRGVAAVAYAGETRLYVSDERLRRLTREGDISQVARLPGAANQIAASADLVALVVQRGSTLQLLAGPPAGPLRTLATCRGPVPELPYAPMAVAGDVVAEALSCPRGLPKGASATRIHVGDAVRVEPAPSGRLVVALAGAPGVLATATVGAEAVGDPNAPVRIEVRSTATGALLYAVRARNGPGLEPTLAAQQDGTIVFCGPRDRLAWASPSAPDVHALADVGCPYSTELAIVGGVVLHRSGPRGTLQTTELATGRSHALIPNTDMLSLPFAWNGHTALVRGRDCAEDFVGAIDADAAPYRGRSCPTRVVSVRRTQSPSAIAITVACPAGCRGELQFSIGGVAERTTFEIRHHGRSTIPLVLRQALLRKLQRYRSVPYALTGFYENPRTSGSPVIAHTGRLPGDGTERYPRSPFTEQHPR